EAARRNLDVLRPYRGAHIIDGQAIADELLRVDPDPHCRFRGEELELAHAFHTTQLVVDVARGIVGQCRGVRCSSAVLVTQRVDQQKSGAGLLDLDALVTYRLWQTSFGVLEPVLHIDLRQVGMGAWLEGDGD